MKNIILLISIVITSSVFSQMDLYISPGFGVGYSKGNLTLLLDSYSSYLRYLDENVPNDTYTADKNWNTNSVVSTFSFHLGVSGEGVMFGASFFPYRLKQERTVIRESGYGRKFVWTEKRNEWLIDLGYGSKYFDVFGSFGINSNNYKMASYQIYPDGTLNLGSEYNFNGLFKQYDGGISYGLGTKIKPLNFLAIELRYIIANDNFPGEKKGPQVGDDTSLSDNAYARTPGTESYPADYTKPLNFENEIVPNFKRSYLQFTILYFFRKNDNKNTKK